MQNTIIYHRNILVNGMNIFYREAGIPSTCSLLLLHGFPTSSHMFRNLIPILAEKHHVIAPDLPGFGLSATPPAYEYDYTFDNLAKEIQAFVDQIGLVRIVPYIFDYGAPIGLRLAIANPKRITAIISQNGNIYNEGLSSVWLPLKAYWKDPSDSNRNLLLSFLTLEITKSRYESGVEDLSMIAPEGYLLDQYFLERAGSAEIQLDLMRDYQSNIDRCAEFQDYFREFSPKFLAVWGENDPIFLPAGANAFLKDNHRAEIKFYPTGHFALETHWREIAADILSFMDEQILFDLE